LKAWQRRGRYIVYYSIGMEATATLTRLPDDPAALQALVLAMGRQCDEVAQRCDDAVRQRDEWQVKFQNSENEKQSIELARQALEIEKQKLELARQEMEVEKLRLEVELLRLRKLYYGPRADRLQTPGDLAQLLLDFAVELEARPVNLADLPPADAAAPVDVATVRRVRRGRRNLADAANLPVLRQEHDLPDAEKPCPCCGTQRQRIGQDVTWQVEYIPGHFQRIEHLRFKYACPHCEHNAENPNIVLADKPAQPIDKGMAGPGLLAYIVTSKYADYLPLYRLENIFARNGFAIDRAALSVWCGDVADLLQPLHELMIQRMLESHVISTDDTIMPLLWPGKTKQARMWVYLGDDLHPYNVFDFTMSRSRDGPANFLKNYRQTLLADAYGGYDGVVVGNGMTRAGCWAHARRKFVDAETTQPAIAAEAVAMIRQLYAVEDRAQALSDQDRLALRQTQSQPLLDRLHERLVIWQAPLLPKHPMAQAINYTLNQWPELNVFASDGAVPIDNNVGEREMKRVALNRNYAEPMIMRSNWWKTA